MKNEHSITMRNLVLTVFNLAKAYRDRSMSYRPLPECLHIAKSPIDGGHGLFAKEDIAADIVLGISHVRDERFQHDYIRTPLGGFFNHSDEPNCKAYIEGDFIKLKTIKPISKGEELTASYWLYQIGD